MQTEMLSPSSASNSTLKNLEFRILNLVKNIAPNSNFKIPNSNNYWQKGFTYRGIFTVYIVMFLCLALAVFFFFFYPRTEILGALENNKTLSYTEAMNEPALLEVNQLMEFPKDREVTYGVIKDKETLEKYQEYFKKAQTGQLLIILDQMTIIYDPNTKTIVDVANVKLY